MYLLRNIKKDIERYGEKGDQTLEYIGINFENGELSEYKCYRFAKSLSSDLQISNNPFANHSILRQLDFQKNYDDNTYRISYKIDLSECHEKANAVLKQHINYIVLQSKYKADIARIILNINNYIKSLLLTEMEPICVLGCKVDSLGRVYELKAYYQLKIYKRHKLVSCFADTEKYLRIIEFMGKMEKVERKQVDRIKNIFKIALDNDFEPMMLGINIRKEISSIKYYFQTNEKFFKRNDYYKLKYFSDSKEMEKNIQQLIALGLEIKGFTIPYSNRNMRSAINLYFCEI